MKPSSPMVFRLADLPVERQISLPADFIADAMAGAPGQSSLEDQEPGAVDVDVSVAEEMGSVMARGQLRGWACVACSRCLGPVRLTVEESFFLTFLPHEQHAEAETELELNEDDLDVSTYRGDEIDISVILRDHLVLSVPYAPLCSESCKGLCPQCGADRNIDRCGCEPVADARWEALKKLKVE